MTRRLIRRAFGWLANHIYPDGVLYGPLALSYGSDMKMTFTEFQEGCAFAMIRAAIDNDATSIKVTVTGAEIEGVDHGDWEITARKVEKDG